MREIDEHVAVEGIKQVSVLFTDTNAQVPWLTVPPHLQAAVSKRQAEYLAGRYCAGMAIKALFPNEPLLQVASAVDRSPEWPPGLTGSITHCLGFASAAVCRLEDWWSFGIDSESRHRGSALRGITRIALSASEGELIRTTSFLPEDLAGLIVFSAKESIYKCFYKLSQEFFGFDYVEITNLTLEGRFSYEFKRPLPNLPDGYGGQGLYKLSPDRLHSFVGIRQSLKR